LSPPNESPSNPVRYRKLPGDFRGFFRRHSLWLGSDHLLQVDSSRFSETYKRFYLHDIQTIIVRRTPRFVLPYYWVLLAGMALIALLIGLAPARGSYFWPAVLILAGVAVYLYTASMFQSCTCHLITRVNKIQLPSLFRVRAARRFVEIMTPQIIAAQGQLPADWIERSTTLEELSTAADRNPDTPVDLLPAHEFSWVTVVVFALVLADAGITWMQLRTNNSSTLSTPSIFNMVLVAICATIAIVRLSRTKGGGPLRMLVLAGLLVVAAATYGSVLVESFDQQFFHRRYTNLLEYPGMRPLGLAEILADFAVAIPGLLLAFRQSRGVARPAISFANPGASFPATEAPAEAPSEAPKP
jgi:hypothetical protein